MRYFRIGDGILGLDADDPPLNERFEQIYGDCATMEPGSGLRLACHVRSGPRDVKIIFDDPQDLDVAAFSAAVFPGRDPGVRASADGREISVTAAREWRPFVANLAISRLLRLQDDVMFFHAASLVINGRGIMACGPKRSGKTTMALALAARGHSLFGDELAAVRLAAREILPVRRSLAVRAGPASSAARRALEIGPTQDEVFPDGERRERAAISALFPETVKTAAPLTTVLLLRKFADAPQFTVAAVAPQLVADLTPLAASLWQRSAGAVAFRLMRLLGAVRVFNVDPGPPEQTARQVEQLLENAP
jgi:hypothetical protein